MDSNLFDSFSDILVGLGLEPFEDDIETIVTDFARGHGVDPEQFHTAYMRYMAGV